MSRIIAIRAEPSLTETIDAGRSLGLTIEPMPLFEIVPLAWSPPDPAEVDALLVGSVNTFRHGGEGLQAFRDKPVYAVGQRTADEARACGFTVAYAGDSGLQRVLDILPPPMRFLRIGGEERVEVTPKERHTLVQRACYRVEPLAIRDSQASLLQGGGMIVLLHSAAAARHFASECDRIGILRSDLALAAIAPRVAGAAGSGWVRIEIAGSPRDDALLALARDMCH